MKIVGTGFITEVEKVIVYQDKALGVPTLEIYDKNSKRVFTYFLKLNKEYANQIIHQIAYILRKPGYNGNYSDIIYIEDIIREFENKYKKMEEQKYK